MAPREVTLFTEMSLLSNATAMRLLTLCKWRPSTRHRLRKARPDSPAWVFATAALGDLLVLDRLIAAGADVNRPWEGFTPLMAAALEGQSHSVCRLLEGKANPNTRHPTGLTALLCAIRSRSQASVQLLLDHGAHPRRLRPGDLAPLDLARLLGLEQIAGRLRNSMARYTSSP